ncbi:MAG TPA: hypothetical protein DCL41_01340 [Bdellovibrionales bacterium]|nr:hypothetical protein [Bdellovibrionales bacterium]
MNSDFFLTPPRLFLRIIRMKISKTLIFLFFGLALLTSTLEAKTLFDGYYRIDLNDKHVGYMVIEYRYDEKTKTFTHLSFLTTTTPSGKTQESLKAQSNEKLEPLSYSYTAQVGEDLKTIDAQFKGQIMKVKITDGKTKAQNLTFKNPKGSFLSSFLTYLMLQKGISIGTKFTYKGIAEEDGNNYNGEAWVKEKTEYNSIPSYKILNKFKGDEFVSFISEKGEILGTFVPNHKLTAQLVSTPPEATKGMMVPHKTLELLFGKVPLGRTNHFIQKPVDKKAKSEPKKESK